MIVNRTAVACVALLVLGVLLFSVSDEGGSGDPVGLVGSGEVELGDVDPREGIPVAFALKNGGHEPATMLSVVRSCDCTVLEEIEGRRIEAGGTLNVRGAIDARGRRGPTRSVLYMAYRLGREKTPRRFQVAVTARVRESVKAAPAPVASGPARGVEAPGPVQVGPSRSVVAAGRNH